MLTFDGDALLISDSKGTPRHYAWALLDGGGAFAVRLTREDTGASYVVRRQRYGWTCTCPSSRWRSRSGPCKHQLAAAELERLCRRLREGVGREVVA